MSIQPGVIKQGSLVCLCKRPGKTYQVVNVDAFSDCVWVRRWPLQAERRPTFGVPLNQVLSTPEPRSAG